MNRLISKLLFPNLETDNDSTAEILPSSSRKPSTTTSNSETTPNTSSSSPPPSSSTCSPSGATHHLITQTVVDTKKYRCPYLDRGFCRETSKCNFSHDLTESIRIPNDYCHFYLANQCLYGHDCKFRHSEPYLSRSNSSANYSRHLENPNCLSQNAQNSSNYNSDRGHGLDDSEPNSPRQWPSPALLENRLKESTQNGFRPEDELDEDQIEVMKNYPLCPYSLATGFCQYPPGECSYLHGLICDLCGLACLHPYDMDQQRKHRDDCLREHEREMELSFAVQRSRDKVCGICMDTVVEKKPITSSRFGILEKCNHIFCLDCIRKWRCTKQFDTRTIRACPECRVSSDFVVPSKYWVEDQDDKEKLIHDYKIALRSKPCKYFNEGKGTCPFAGSCFYKHAYPDGTLAKLDAPKPKRRLYGSAFSNYVLWTILASTDEEEWTNDDDGESLYLPLDYSTDDDDDDVQEDRFEVHDARSLADFDLIL